MKPISTATFFTLAFFSGTVKAQISFSNLDSLLRYATAKSISLQSGDIRLQQAKKAKLAAAFNIPEVTGNVSFSYTNNTKLPVNLFPAETFGGEPGTYKEIQTGVQYVSNLNENIDIKLLNLKGWENLKLAKLNIEATASDNKITLKLLHENIATAYFNILTLQEQKEATKLNLAAADTLVNITKKKYEQGLVKQQDVNDATVSYLTTKESIRQIEFLTAQQYLGLKILCDIPETENLQVVQKIQEEVIIKKSFILPNSINITNGFLKEKVAFSNYKQLKYSLYPAISFFQAYTTQQYNTRGKLFDNSVNWIPSSYIGLKLSIPIPNASTIAQASNAKFDYLLAKKTTEQQIIKSGIETKQLSVDYDKAVSQAQSNKEIYELRKDTYQKNQSLYAEGLISLDHTLTSFNAMVTGSYNLISSNVNVLLAKAKIDINNRIK
jgi:outer membrane protein TolC